MSQQDDQDAIALQTLALLEARLQRIEFALVGANHQHSNTSDLLDEAKRKNRDYSIRDRLITLEGALTKLANGSHVVKEILTLYAEHPDIFTSTLPAHVDPPASSLSTTEKLVSLNAAAPLFQTTASQLTAIKDSPIPDPEISAELIQLQPRIDRVAVMQEGMMQEMAGLRARSARVLEAWYLEGVEGVNRRIAEWDEKVRRVDVLVRRKEREDEVD